MIKKNELQIEALTLPKRMFNMPSQGSLDLTGNSDQLEHLQDLQIPKINASDVTILIGANAPDAFLQVDLRKGQPNEPYALKTMLGWSLLGNITKNEGNKVDTRYCINHFENIRKTMKMMHQIVKRFWETEDCFNVDSRETAMSIEDKECLRVLEAETKNP